MSLTFGQLQNITFYVKTDWATFWATFGIFWTTFGIFWTTLYFNIWSHCMAEYGPLLCKHI